MNTTQQKLRKAILLNGYSPKETAEIMRIFSLANVTRAFEQAPPRSLHYITCIMHSVSFTVAR